MESPERVTTGGILGLVEYLAGESRWEALMVDFIRCGRSIHTASWAEIKAMLRFAPKTSQITLIEDPLAWLQHPRYLSAGVIANEISMLTWVTTRGAEEFKPVPFRQRFTATNSPVQQEEEGTAAPQQQPAKTAEQIRESLRQRQIQAQQAQK